MEEDALEENKLYNLAYRHLLYRIHFGFYPTGSKLPTISELCKTFQVSNFTIHSALKMLEKEHFVSLCQGRSAIVTYGAQTEAHQAYFLLSLIHISPSTQSIQSPFNCSHTGFPALSRAFKVN